MISFLCDLVGLLLCAWCFYVAALIIVIILQNVVGRRFYDDAERQLVESERLLADYRARLAQHRAHIEANTELSRWVTANMLLASHRQQREGVRARA